MPARGYTNRGAGRKRKYPPPTQEEVQLILDCKEERNRLREELAVLAKIDAVMYRDEIRQIRREISQLTDRSLAEKFEQTQWTIARL